MWADAALGIDRTGLRRDRAPVTGPYTAPTAKAVSGEDVVLSANATAATGGGTLMREAKKNRITAGLQPYLEPGETIFLITGTGVGRVSVKRHVGVAVVWAVLSLGHVHATVRPRGYFVALTDRRLIFIDPEQVKKNGLDVSWALDLSALRTEPCRGPSLTKRFDLAADDLAPMRLGFVMSQRADAETIRSAVDVRAA